MHTSLRAIAGVVLAATLASAAPLPASVTLKRDYLRKNLSLRGGQGPSLTRSASQQDMSKPNVKRPGPQAATEVSKKIWSLSSQYKPADKTSIQKYVDVQRPASCFRCCCTRVRSNVCSGSALCLRDYWHCWRCPHDARKFTCFRSLCEGL